MRRADLVEATQCFRVREIRYAFNAPLLRNCGMFISVCRKHVVAATGSSPFKVGDNQRPERTMFGVAKISAESSVPGGNLTRGRRRNQFWRGHGSPSVLNEVFSNLARLCASKSANGPRKNSFRPDSPLTTISHGDKRLIKPPHHTGHGQFRTRPPTSVKSPIKITCTLRAQVTAFNHIKCIKLLTNIL